MVNSIISLTANKQTHTAAGRQQQQRSTAYLMSARTSVVSRAASIACSCAVKSARMAGNCGGGGKGHVSGGKKMHNMGWLRTLGHSKHDLKTIWWKKISPDARSEIALLFFVVTKNYVFSIAGVWVLMIASHP